MLYTANLNLKKPQPEDYAKIADLNENADKIDAAIANLMNKGTLIVTGTYNISPTNSTLALDVGFTPDLVIIYTAYNNQSGVAQSAGTAQYQYIPVILSNAIVYTSGYKIVENGFIVVNSGNVTITQYYIAIKF